MLIRPTLRSSFMSLLLFTRCSPQPFFIFIFRLLMALKYKSECTLPAHVAELCGNDRLVDFDPSHTHIQHVSTPELQHQQHTTVTLFRMPDVQKDFHCHSFQKHPHKESDSERFMSWCEMVQWTFIFYFNSACKQQRLSLISWFISWIIARCKNYPRWSNGMFFPMEDISFISNGKLLGFWMWNRWMWQFFC